MKIGMFTSMLPQIARYKGMTRLEAIKYLYGLGVRTGEAAMGEFGENYVNAKTYCDELKEGGITLEAAHELISLTDKDVDNSDRVKRALDKAADLGCKYFLIVPGYASSVEEKKAAADRIIERLIPLSEFARDRGMKLTMENFSQELTPYSTPEELIYILDNVPLLGYTYDTGNFSYRSLDAMEAFGKLKKYLAFVHAKDLGERLSRENGAPEAYWDGKKIHFYSAHIGGGSVGFDSILDALKKEGYEGSLIIEQSASKGPDDHTNIMEGSVKWLNERGIY